MSISTTLNAQNSTGNRIFLIAGSNITMPRLTSYKILDYKGGYNLGWQFGFGSSLQIQNNITLNPAVLYENRSIYIKNIVPKTGPEIYPYAIRLKFSKFSVPIHLKFSAFDRIGFLCGPKLSYILKAEENVSDCGGFKGYKKNTNKFRSPLLDIDFGVDVRILKPKLYFRFIYSLHLTSNVDYQYPFFNNDFKYHSINTSMVFYIN